MQFITPIIRCKNNSNNMYVKRDDLLPFSFGGNKVRIAEEYFADMKSRKQDCMIGYGNARSNLCRVLANMSSSLGYPCHIISPSDDNGDRIETNNSKIVKLCGAEFHTCDKNNVALKVEEVLNKCKRAGQSPYYIYGDMYGKGNEAIPIRAYKKVYDEIKQQEIDLEIKFDYIFLATGTGMTQAGLLAGVMQHNDHRKVIGISIARESTQEIDVIKNYIDEYFRYENIDIHNNIDICVIDQYVCGGYGKYNRHISNTIERQFKENGIPLDATYTGKAFYGMEAYLKYNNITNKNILFIHTGGTPLFFDCMSNLTI